MPDEHKTVFISYRRSAAAFIARAIFLDLRRHHFDVFLDVESINAGQFDTIILNQIEARAHFLIILTPGTLERCAEPNDWLRHEIEYAMEKQRNIVPLLVNGFSFAGMDQYLTGKLAELPRFNGLNVPHDYFDAAMDKLRERFLKQPVTGSITPVSAHDQVAVERRLEAVAAQPAPTAQQLSAEKYALRAYQKAEVQDLEGALTDYTEAIRLNPHYAEAYINRGGVRQDTGNLDAAIADYDEAIRLNPENAEAYINRGTAHQDKGNLGGAITDLTEAIRLNPKDSKAYYNRGVARADKDDLDGAMADYDEAIRLNPYYAKPYSNRGVARQGKGDLDGAIADYDEAIRLNPQLATAYYNRGIARYLKGDLEDALDDYSQVLRINPQDAAAYNDRGEAYFASSQFDQALEDFRQANTLRPAYKMTLGGLAVTQDALGHKTEAKRIWRTFLALDRRYRDADWVGRQFKWRPELIEAARKLIAEL